MTKYHARRTKLDGHVFDSAAEAKRYSILKLMERQGVIKDLRLQVPYELLPPQRDSRGRAVRAVTYVADFVYHMDGQTVVEDVKGMKTQVYQLKKKLMLWRHGIDVQEVSA